MKHTYLLLITLLLLAGCSTSPQKGNNSHIEIKVSQTPDEKEITLQEIAEEINYIPLETNDTICFVAYSSPSAKKE